MILARNVGDMIVALERLTQRIGHPDTERLLLLTPVADGTRLELTARWPAPTVRKTHAEQTADTIATHLRETADAYKEHIEKAAGTPS